MNENRAIKKSFYFLFYFSFAYSLSIFIHFLSPTLMFFVCLSRNKVFVVEKCSVLLRHAFEMLPERFVTVACVWGFVV